MADALAQGLQVAVLHYSAPPVVGGVEAVVHAHCRLFSTNRIPNAVLAGRGEQDALPEGTRFVHIPEMDSRHPEILELNTALESGSIPDQFEEQVGSLAERLDAALEPYTHVIVHNVFTKHFNLPLTVALNRLAKVDATRRWIAWCHDLSWTSENSRRRMQPGYPWDLLREPIANITYVTISEERKRDLVRLFHCSPGEVQVIYNGVDARELLALSSMGNTLVERLGLLDSDLNILMPVRVTQAKNVELALEIASALKRRGVNFRLVLTGPPDPHDPGSLAYFALLQQKRDRLGLQQEMHFIYESGAETRLSREIPYSVVTDLLRASDLMLMTSHREGFGLPVLEAGLLGLVVFSTPVPAAFELAEELIEMVDPQADPDQVAVRILAVMEATPAHRFRREVRRRYRWQAVFRDQLLPLLRR